MSVRQIVISIFLCAAVYTLSQAQTTKGDVIPPPRIIECPVT
jgi:hypothetical protein